MSLSRPLAIVMTLMFVSCGTQQAPAPAEPATPRAAEIIVPPAPAARVEVVSEDLHGEKISDPYRWMEKTSDEYTAWLDAQDKRARTVLAALPRRAEMLEAINASDRGVARADVVRVTGPDAQPRVFLRRRAPEDETWKVWVGDGWSGNERLLIDPSARNSGATHYSVDYIAPSSDGRYVAYGISASGSEDSVIEVMETDSGNVLHERIDRSQYAGISWRPDNRSFFYWRRAKPAPGAPRSEWFRNSATYLHRLGDDPEKAQPLFGPMFKTLGIAEESFSWIQATEDSKWIVAGATPGTSADIEFFVAPAASIGTAAAIPWRRVSTNADHLRALTAHGDELYALSYDKAPRFKMVTIDAESGTAATARDFVPPATRVLENFAAARDGLYLLYLDRGISQIERIGWDGAGRTKVEMPEGAVAAISGEPYRDGVVFSLSGWTTPLTAYEYQPGAAARDLHLSGKAPVDYSHLQIREVEVRSADGTLVPMSIVHRRDAKLDGTRPAVLDGYAAYGMSQSPYFNPISLAWVDRGGIFAECHSRGGGAYGEEWHLAGSKLNKERGIEDSIACAEYLIQNHFTSASRLSITGTSAGGVLAGGAITRRPELFTAALLRVPMVNLSRFEFTEGGPANVPEFGALSDAVESKALHASDPYHRIKPGTRYPAMIVTAGAHDVRVPAWIAAKFVARMQAESKGGPVLLRVEREAGHGLGSQRSRVREEWADLYAFALWRSGE